MAFAQVILPVKLAWQPWYRVPEGTCRGQGVRVMLGGKELKGVVHRVQEEVPGDVAPERIRPVEEVLQEMPPVGKASLRFWEQVAGYYLCTLGEVFKAGFHCWEEPASITREKARLAKMARSGKTVPADIPEPTAPIRLSPAQQTVRDGIAAALKDGSPCLLEGVTGSGKTEIYLSLACEMLERGKCVLYMVPEIALSRQLEERLQRIVGERLRTFHSKETPARRARLCWELSRTEGTPLLVLGTRSSILLPPERFGLIIVDEEHDGSYKQESPAPRYNGRDCALMLSQILGKCPLVLGSATPSLESLYNCEKGKMRHFLLREKYHKALPADILLVNTVEESRKRGMRGSFSIKLIELINDCLGQGGQAVILRSRKAYAPYVQCSRCGHIPKCKRCNLPLSYNKASGRLVCHHCGRNRTYAAVCPECSGALLPVGAGTQKIEEEAAALFPQARIARLDSDVAGSVLKERKIIEAFSRGETDLLIGTQMVTKGFDFPGLRLVAVIDADALLSLDDFRADEKALQTLEQLRGRCSRRDEKGLFVIQTRLSQHPVFDSLRSGLQFGLEERMSERKDFSYPPYTRLVDIQLEDYREERLQEKCGKLAGRLGGAGFEYIGPYAPGSGKTAGKFQRCLRVPFAKNRSLPERKAELAALLERFGREEKYADNVSVNVDPL